MSCQDNNTFCDGVEVCDNGSCISPGNPCPVGQSCIEGTQSCVDCDIVASNLPDCAVDAGQPHDLNAQSPPQGPLQMQLTFNQICPVAGLAPSDFSVSVTPGPAPAGFMITQVLINGPAATLQFNEALSVGHWTCVTHVASGEFACNGVLPGDSDGSGTSESVDVQALVESLGVPPIFPLPSFATDMDRSGMTDSSDVIQAMNLLNGAEAFDPWLGAALPPCPGAECVASPDGTGCSSDGNSCTQDVCQSGECANLVLPDGTGCDDGNPNTDSDNCTMGICVGLAGPAGMVLIPAGEFQMGDSFGEGGALELPVRLVYLDAFYIDRHEVTNQQYVDALNWAWSQGNLITVPVPSAVVSGPSFPYCDTMASSASSRITWDEMSSVFGVVSGKENHPMVMVSWYGSAAYANWRSGMEGRTPAYDNSTWACDFNANGYRLPTEAEWEKAARGGVSGHRFPWSDAETIQHARANYQSVFGGYDDSPTSGYHNDFDVELPYTSPVGSFAPNGYGLYDMAGNVWELCNDGWDGSAYMNGPDDNPHGPISGTHRVLRGGAWDYVANHLRCAHRNNVSPLDYRDDSYGFRLALDIE